MIYLDYNATTSVHPEVRRAIHQCLCEDYGNPSSSHQKGRAAKAIVDKARASVASVIGARPSELTFTGSATESNNLAMLGACERAPLGRRRVIISAVEHPAVVEPAKVLERRGWDLQVAPVDPDGRVNLTALEALMVEGPTFLVSVMLANNELGTLQPVNEVGRLCRQHGALFHVDAAQAMGKVSVNVDAMQADLLTIAGHKMYAPKGIGALYVRDGTAIAPLQFGASQEGGIRPGTENVAYIAGLGMAAELIGQAGDAPQRMAMLRDALQTQLLESIHGLVVNGSQLHRLPNTLHVSLPSGTARALIAMLADKIALSPGAACHSDHGDQPSGVMRAIGATVQQANGALRISLGYDTTEADIRSAGQEIAAAYRQMQAHC